MIEGLSHMTFIVRDLERMTRILEGVFDAREVFASDAAQFSLSREKFFLIGDIWIAIMQGEKLAERSYNHIAFKIDDADFDRYAERVGKLCLDMRPPRPRVEGEGRSIFFVVKAEDEREPIGDGTHERVVVNVERFDKRVQRKIRGE